MESRTQRCARTLLGRVPTSDSAYRASVDTSRRASSSARALELHPTRVPVVAEPAFVTSGSIDRCKYLVPRGTTAGQFLNVLRSRLDLQAVDAMFLFVGASLPTPTTTMGELYDRFSREDDRLLYIKYDTENVFG